MDRQAGQVGELCGQQPPDEVGVDVDLPVVQLHPAMVLRPDGGASWLDLRVCAIPIDRGHEHGATGAVHRR